MKKPCKHLRVFEFRGKTRTSCRKHWGCCATSKMLQCEAYEEIEVLIPKELKQE